MYNTILLALDGVAADRAIVEHVKPLAKLAQSRVVLLHVDDWTSRTHRQETLYPGATDDFMYLKKICAEFQSSGIPAEPELAYGDPVMEIVKQVRQKGCDLVVMSTQRQRSLAEIIFGTTASRVQKGIGLPVLMLGAKQMAKVPAFAA